MQLDKVGTLFTTRYLSLSLHFQSQRQSFPLHSPPSLHSGHKQHSSSFHHLLTFSIAEIIII